MSGLGTKRSTRQTDSAPPEVPSTVELGRWKDEIMSFLAGARRELGRFDLRSPTKATDRPSHSETLPETLSETLDVSTTDGSSGSGAADVVVDEEYDAILRQIREQGLVDVETLEQLREDGLLEDELLDRILEEGLVEDHRCEDHGCEDHRREGRAAEGRDEGGLVQPGETEREAEGLDRLPAERRGAVEEETANQEMTGNQVPWWKY